MSLAFNSKEPGHDKAQPSDEPRRRHRRSLLPVWFVVFSVAFLGIFGVALARAGTIRLDHQADLAAANAQNDQLCQVLVEKAMQASEDHCDHMGPNQVCYGNKTLNAQIQPNAGGRFSIQGDVVPVDQLLRLSAAPLNVDTSEWGVAIFKVMANFPGSLPGQTVRMVVFGNFVLDNRSANLEAFYFSSQLGRLVCDKAPVDGMLITMPDGAGVHFNINGTDLTLNGDASLTAIKNGEMVVALYDGHAKIRSRGREQVFKAGEKVSVPLGGENGTQAIGVPSSPKPLSDVDLFQRTFMSSQSVQAQYGAPPVLDNPDQAGDFDEANDNPGGEVIVTQEDEDEDDKDKDKEDKDKDKEDKDKDKEDKDKDK